jgi:hypothetical protein
MKFSAKYGSSIPMGNPIEDDWSAEKVVEFLRENDITPVPRPPHKVLVAVSCDLIKVKTLFMNMLNNIPDDDEELQKLGGQVLDSAPGAQLPPPASTRAKMKLFIEPQIPIGTNFSTLPVWSGKILGGPCTTEKIFSVSLGWYVRKVQGDRAFEAHRLSGTAGGKDPFIDMMETFQIIADTFDKHSSKCCCIVQDKAQTVALAVMPIEARVHGESNFDGIFPLLVPLPIIGVKFFFARKDDGPGVVENLQRGLKGLKANNIETTVEEVEIMAKLLKRNRSQLDPDPLSEREKNLPRKWFFSALCPANPQLKASVVERCSETELQGALCPGCGIPGKLQCASCKLVWYCSKACQKACWKKEHKQLCGKGELCEGAMAEVFGLVSEAGQKINGIAGQLGSFQPETGRWSISLQGKCRAIKLSNLRLMHPASTKVNGPH